MVAQLLLVTPTASAYGIINGALCHGYTWGRGSTGDASVTTSKAAASDCNQPRVRARRADGSVTNWRYESYSDTVMLSTFTQGSAASNFVGGGHGLFNPFTPAGSGGWVQGNT